MSSRAGINPIVSWLNQRALPENLRWWLVIHCLLALVVAWLLGPRHDYKSYILQWQHILSGANPWVGLDPTRANTYGPLHSLLALAAWWHPLVPKMVFMLLWVHMNALILQNCEPQKFRRTLWFVMFWPFLWKVIPDRGFNDIWVSWALVVGLHYHQQPLRSAAAMGIGCLTKFFPLVAAPFLILNRRWNWRFFAAFLLIGTAGMAISTWIYGVDTFAPFTNMGDRPSKLYSLFRFLRSDLSPLQLLGISSLDHLSLPLVMACLVSYFFWVQWRQIPLGTAVLGSVITCLLFFKVGHIQFYIPVFFLAAYLWSRDQLNCGRQMAWYLFYLTMLEAFYTWTGGYHAPYTTWMRQFLGLPTFVFNLWILWHLVGRREGRAGF